MTLRTYPIPREPHLIMPRTGAASIIEGKAGDFVRPLNSRPVVLPLRDNCTGLVWVTLVRGAVDRARGELSPWAHRFIFSSALPPVLKPVTAGADALANLLLLGLLTKTKGDARRLKKTQPPGGGALACQGSGIRDQ